MTKPKRAYLALIAAIAATPAIAGEIGGNGEYTPVNGGVANSICAFSGRNDDTSGPSDLVQSYGQIIAAFRGRAPFHGIPGTECNGS